MRYLASVRPQFRSRPAILGLALLVLIGLAVSPASAQRLPSIVSPQHYTLKFDIDLANARFTGDETIDVTVGEPTNRIVLNAVEITFAEVTVENQGRRQRATVTTTDQLALLTVPGTLPAGPATIHVAYKGVLNNKLRGLYLSQANGRRYVISQMESTDARRAFPGFDEPAFKATYDISATIDAGDMAISNGRVISDTPGPGANRHTVTFSQTAKMSSYLVALAVGDFACLSGEADKIPVRVCATKDKVQLGQLALEAAEQIVTFYNKWYDIKYPFGKIDLLAAPDFAAGAMENTGAIFYRERLLLADTATASVDSRKAIASVLAHEMAHQWFGDLVTMAWWDDIWLNEGFANWMQNLPLKAWKPEWHIEMDEAQQTQNALELDSLAATRPIQANVETNNDIDALFDPISYDKGASVLRMVEGFIGPDAFRKGVNAYLAKFAYRNATSKDFWQVMAESSGQPVDAILSSFVTQPGAPVVIADISCDNGEEHRRLTGQRFAIGPTAPRPSSWTIPVCIKDGQLGDRRCLSLNAPAGVVGLQVGASPVSDCPRPWLFLNAGATGYYRSQYPPALLAAMAPRVQSTLSAPERFSFVSDEWALVRANRHGVGDYLTLVSGYGRETNSTIIASIANRFSAIRNYLTTADTRTKFDTFVRALFDPLASELGPNTVPGEDTERTTSRASVMRMIAAAGGTSAMVEYVRQAVDDALVGRKPLDPATATSLVNFAGNQGDAALYDRYLAASKTATSPEERDRWLMGLASFTQPALVQRSLDFSLTPNLRSQDTPIFLASLLSNPATNDRTWAFLKQHYGELQPKALNFLGGANIGSALSSFCDAKTRDDIQAFFKTHALPSGERALAQSVERINSCIGLKEAQTPKLTEWLAKGDAYPGR